MALLAYFQYEDNLKYNKVLFYTQHIKIDKENKLVHLKKKLCKTKIVLCI